jgi:hypothetical protein
VPTSHFDKALRILTDRGKPQFAAGAAVAVPGDRAGQPGLATVGLVEGRRFAMRSISVPLIRLEVGVRWAVILGVPARSC